MRTYVTCQAFTLVNQAELRFQPLGAPAASRFGNNRSWTKSSRVSHRDPRSRLPGWWSAPVAWFQNQQGLARGLAKWQGHRAPLLSGDSDGLANGNNDLGQIVRIDGGLS